MDKRVEEIKMEINSLERKFKIEKEKLQNEQLQIRSKCTHPEIGEVFMFICSDCGYNGGPESYDELSERDYENYSENIEKTRKWRRTLKAKFTREEIVKMAKDLKEKFSLLEKRQFSEITKLNEELKTIKSNCVHKSKKNNICEYCEAYLG